MQIVLLTYQNRKKNITEDNIHMHLSLSLVVLFSFLGTPCATATLARGSFSFPQTSLPADMLRRTREAAQQHESNVMPQNTVRSYLEGPNNNDIPLFPLARCDDIPAVHQRRMVNCSLAYWYSQVYGFRAQGIHGPYQWASNCFAEDIISAPLGINSSFGKAAVLAGYGEVSTINQFGIPYFENNTGVQILSWSFGCDLYGNPTVTVRVNRNLTYPYNVNVWTTVPYFSTFTYTHVPNHDLPPQDGVPDWVISHYEYMPLLLKEDHLWPGSPNYDNRVAKIFLCGHLNAVCGPSLNWSAAEPAYQNCWQWMEGHPLTSPPPILDFVPGIYPFTQSCVYFADFMSIAPANVYPAPQIYCPVIQLCISPSAPSRRRDVAGFTEQEGRDMYHLSKYGTPSEIYKYMRNIGVIDNFVPVLERSVRASKA